MTNIIRHLPPSFALIYPKDKSSGCRNLLLIDNAVPNAQLFASSVNISTFPVIYSASSLKNDIMGLLLRTNFSNINRIGIVFSSDQSGGGTSKAFLDGKSFSDNENVDFIVSLLREFSVQHIDYLACDTLNFPSWVKYYEFLTRETGVLVGASNNKTGNLKYGGDWVMESTSQDIELIYFTKSIEYYTYLLDASPLYPTWASLNDYGNGILVNGDFMYVSCPLNGFITKLNLSDGSVVKSDWATGFNWPAGLEAEGDYMYVANSGNNTISKVSLLTGLCENYDWVTGLNTPLGLVINGQYLYVTNFGGDNIFRVTLSNSSEKVIWATGLDGPVLMCIQEEIMYVTTTDKIALLNLVDGSVSSYWGVGGNYMVIYGQFTYVVDNNTYTILRLNLSDGSFDQYSFLLGVPCYAMSMYGQSLVVSVIDPADPNGYDRIVILDTAVTTAEMYTALQMKQAGYTSSQLKQVGYTDLQLLEAGYYSILSQYNVLNSYYHTFYTTSATNPTVMTRTIYKNTGAVQETLDISFGGMNISDVLHLMDDGGSGSNPYTIGIVDSSQNKICMNLAYSNVYTKALTARQQSIIMTHVNTTYKEPHTYANVVYTVTVSGGVYWLATGDGAASQQPNLTLSEGMMYVFDQSHASNVGNTLVLGQDRDTIPYFTTNVVINGTAGSVNAYTLIDLSGLTLPSPALKYFSSATLSMGQFVVPGTPRILSAIAGITYVDVTFSPPVNVGGSAISLYTLTVSTFSEGDYLFFNEFTSAATTIKATGLTKGTTYYFSVSATNMAGMGPTSSISQFSVTTILPTVPGAPTLVSATAGNGSAIVTFTKPDSDGGENIDNYTVTAYTSPSAAAFTLFTGVLYSSIPSPITVLGLTNLTSYYFAVTAHNSIGTSASSAFSSAVIPQPTTPAVPTGFSATAGYLQATLRFTTPDNGGSPITGYNVTVFGSTFNSLPALNRTFTGVSSPLVVTGLTNGVTYYFKVAANNSKGTGSATEYSSVVIPRATAPPPPVITSVTQKPDLTYVEGELIFTSSTTDGSTLSYHTVTLYRSSDNALMRTYNNLVNPTRQMNLDGLTKATSYYLKITATSNTGTSLPTQSEPFMYSYYVPSGHSVIAGAAGSYRSTITGISSASYNPVSDTGGQTITGYFLSVRGAIGSTSFNNPITKPNTGAGLHVINVVYTDHATGLSKSAAGGGVYY